MAIGGGTRVPARRSPHPSLDAVPQVPPREPHEHVVARLRRSARSLTGPLLVFLFLCFGTGYLIVHAGAQGTMILRDVPHARLVQQAVAELIEQSSAQPGVTASAPRRA